MQRVFQSRVAAARRRYPDLLFASYGETMDAAMRIDPEAESGYDPYPMFADILRMECD